jgi:hypothetical protein
VDCLGLCTDINLAAYLYPCDVSAGDNIESPFANSLVAYKSFRNLVFMRPLMEELEGQFSATLVAL